MLPVTSKGNAGFAVAMPTRLATEFTISVFESIVTFPVTVKEDKVPTLVMFGCAAVTNVPVMLVAFTFPVNTSRLNGPYDKAPEEGVTNTTLVVDRAPRPVRATLPATFSEDKVPTDVRLDCVTKDPSVLDVKAVLPPIMYPFEVLTLPDTSRGCDGLSVLIPTNPSI